MPRPRGAKRCVCNYTFEYERPAHELLRRRGGGLPAPGLLVIAAGAAVAGALVAYHVFVPRPQGLVVPAILVGAGLVAVAGTIGGWRWFLGDRKARFLAAVLGETGMRVFYALTGGALAGGGAGLLF